jgi:peptidoglycan L-alanyl-D-glutamate endopeptidase CwlK
MINSRRIEDLHPVVQELCRKHIEACKARGVIIQVTNTLRDAEYQAYLYSLGRTKPGSIVTNMKQIGPHAFGLAYDIVPVVNGKAQWNNVTLWQIAGEEGKKLGLTWGGDWKSIVDKPHFEYTGGLTAAQLRAGKRPAWWWEVKKLTWLEIIRKVADEPDKWEKAINLLVNGVKAAKANGNIGDLGILEYVPILIEKAYNNK